MRVQPANLALEERAKRASKRRGRAREGGRT